jgi:transposase-like protein
MTAPLQRTRWTAAQKAEALRIYQDQGAAAASEATGVPIATISSWARRAGKTAVTPERQARVAAKQLTIAERKGELVVGMLDDIVKLRGQLFAEYVEKKPMIVSDGHKEGSHIAVASVRLSRPAPVDQLRIVEAATKLLDKVMLLSGDATARVEQTGQAAASRAAAITVIDELAARRTAA